MEDILLLPRAERVKRDAVRIKRYLLSTLCKDMGIPNDFVDLSVATNGVKSHVMLVRPRHHEPLALRWTTNQAEAARVIDHLRLAEAHGLPTPRLVYADNSLRHLRRHRFVMVVEGLIEGRHLTAKETTPSNLQTLGKNLARLHAIESKRWGAPEDLKFRSYFGAVIQKKFKNRLDGLTKNAPRFRKQWRADILKFVKSYRKEWTGFPPYALTHDKIHTGNILFGNDNEVYFLDLISLSFGSPGKDLAATLYYFCRDKEEEDLLLKNYFSRLPAEREEHFRRFEPLYRVWHHLNRWTSKVRPKKNVPRSQEDLDETAWIKEREALWSWMEQRTKQF